MTSRPPGSTVAEQWCLLPAMTSTTDKAYMTLPWQCHGNAIVALLLWNCRAVRVAWQGYQGEHGTGIGRCVAL